MVFYAMLAEVEMNILKEEGEGRDALFLYKVCQKFFRKVTSLSFRCRFQEVYASNRHIPYTITHWVDVVSCMMFAGAKKPHNMRLVAKNQWSEVSCFVKLTSQTADRKLALINEFSKGGKIIKSCSLYENSKEKRDLVAAQTRFEAREADKRLQAALKSHRPDHPKPKIDCPEKVPRLKGDF